MTAIIVDDIQLDINLVKKLLSTEIPEVEVVGTATTLVEAESLLIKLHPDLLFLDIHRIPVFHHDSLLMID